MSGNSWREIAKNLDMEAMDCMKRWKTLRDKFVRLKRRMVSKSGDPGGQKTPALLIFMSWLTPHIKHRETVTNVEAPKDIPSTAVAPCVVEPLQLDETLLEADDAPECPCPGPSVVSPAVHSSPAPPTPSTRPPTNRSKRRHDSGELLREELARAEERRLSAEHRFRDAFDEEGRFGSHVADMLRRMRPDVKIASMAHMSRYMFEQIAGQPSSSV